MKNLNYASLIFLLISPCLMAQQPKKQMSMGELRALAATAPKVAPFCEPPLTAMEICTKSAIRNAKIYQPGRVPAMETTLLSAPLLRLGIKQVIANNPNDPDLDSMCQKMRADTLN